MSFLDYRNTPTEGMDSSPVQRLMLKRTKTTLPLAAHLLEPEIQQDVQTRLTLKRRKAKKHFDPGSKELPDLKIGQPIRMTSLPKDGRNKWRRGICLGKVASIGNLTLGSATSHSVGFGPVQPLQQPSNLLPQKSHLYQSASQQSACQLQK